MTDKSLLKSTIIRKFYRKIHEQLTWYILSECACAEIRVCCMLFRIYSSLQYIVQVNTRVTIDKIKMAHTFQQEYMEMPPITRAYTTACVLTTIAVVGLIFFLHCQIEKYFDTSHAQYAIWLNHNTSYFTLSQE